MSLNPLNKPFRVGVRPLSPENWLLVDDRLAHYREQKKVLLERSFSSVYATTDGMHDSETELLEYVQAWLQQHAPEALAGFVETETRSPLVQACLMINEDIAIMRRTAEGWMLASACICFPSLWALSEKIGRILADVHAPVPGFAKGTRQAGIIEQMFDNLREGEPVVRFNYSVHDNEKLHLPDSRESTVMAPDDALKPSHFVRGERQTLTRMAGSGDIVFTIDTSHEKVADLSLKEKQIIASHLGVLSTDERVYKGLSG